MPTAKTPKYADMICAALKALGGKGASRQAINKYIVKEYNLTENNHHHTMLKSNLKRASAVGGPIVHSRGKGAAGSFKLRETKALAKPKSSAKKTVKKQAPKKQVKKATAKTHEAPKEDKSTSVTKSAAPKKASKASTAIKVKKAKSASPKKPKVVKAKKSPKRATKQLPKRN